MKAVRDFFKDKRLVTNPFLCALELMAILLVLWFIMSGIFEFKFIVYAVLTCLGITLLCLPFLVQDGLKTDKRYFLLHVHPGRALVYFFWLLKEIVKSALDVAKVVVRGNPHLQSQIIWFKADYDNPLARAVLANSITLTPGTVTLDILDDGTYSVHALTDGAAEGLLEGTMQKNVAKVFKEDIDYRVITVEERAIPKKTATLLPTRRKKGGRP